MIWPWFPLLRTFDGWLNGISATTAIVHVVVAVVVVVAVAVVVAVVVVVAVAVVVVTKEIEK